METVYYFLGNNQPLFQTNRNVKSCLKGAIVGEEKIVQFHNSYIVHILFRLYLI